MKIPLIDAINLLHRARHATLATQSAQMPGYPYATVVPNVLDGTHCPLLFVSALAEHTKNLLADSRVSLSVLDPDAADVQACARLTLVGDARPIEADDALIARYLRYVPEAENYLGLDFRFFRIDPQRLRYIGGVGQMGWIEAVAWREIRALASDEEARWLSMAKQVCGETVLGVDPFGVDLVRDGKQLRLELGGAALSEAALAQAVCAAGQGDASANC